MTAVAQHSAVQVVFCDWDGVLCHEPFLHDLPVRHPGRRMLDRLFSDDISVQRWMRCEVSERDLLDAFRSESDPQLDWMLRALEHSCRTFHPDMRLLGELTELNVPVLIATDNMPCFERTFEAIPALRGVVSGLVCSTQTRVLKAEPRRFFGRALKELGLAFKDAVLIDDRADNCARFRAVGGAAILHRKHERTVSELRALIAR